MSHTIRPYILIRTTLPPTTTPAPPPKYNDIGDGFKTVTGIGAPPPHIGTCGVKKLKNPKLYASVNSKLKSNSCGWCIFIYCPSFSGCSGGPMKVEIVSEHDGSGDFALSPDAFKIVTGKGLSKRDREALYKSTTRFVSC